MQVLGEKFCFSHSDVTHRHKGKFDLSAHLQLTGKLTKHKKYLWVKSLINLAHNTWITKPETSLQKQFDVRWVGEGLKHWAWLTDNCFRLELRLMKIKDDCKCFVMEFDPLGTANILQLSCQLITIFRKPRKVGQILTWLVLWKADEILLTEWSHNNTNPENRYQHESLCGLYHQSQPRYS